MKAVIKLDVPDWQIGQEVSVYFPDTMVKKAVCEATPEKPRPEKLLPCKCGCTRREHWFGNKPDRRAILICKKCGFEVGGKNQADVRRKWNAAVAGDIK